MFKTVSELTNTIYTILPYSVKNSAIENVVFSETVCYIEYRKSTHSIVDAPELFECPYGHRLSCSADRVGIFITCLYPERERQEVKQSDRQRTPLKPASQ